MIVYIFKDTLIFIQLSVMVLWRCLQGCKGIYYPQYSYPDGLESHLLFFFNFYSLTSGLIIDENMCNQILS